MKLMQVQHATKRFDGLCAVNDVSFSIKKGEILGVIGPNGSGKTTLINLISGTYPLTGGDIFYKDESIKDLQPFQRARKGIARTFQIVKLLQNLTVRDNIMTAALFGRTQITTTNEILHCLSGKYSKSAYAQTQEIAEMIRLREKSDACPHANPIRPQKIRGRPCPCNESGIAFAGRSYGRTQPQRGGRHHGVDPEPEPTGCDNRNDRAHYEGCHGNFPSNCSDESGGFDRPRQPARGRE